MKCSLQKQIKVIATGRTKGLHLNSKFLSGAIEIPLVSSPTWFHDGISLSSQRLDPTDKMALSPAKEASVDFLEGKGDGCEANNDEDKEDGEMAGIE